MVSVETPEPAIEVGLKPPLVTPVGNGDSLPTVRLTFPVNPVTGVTVTVNVVGCPGMTARAGGFTEIEKSGAGGVTVIVRVGGLGSGLPLASITGNDGTESPGALKVTDPGFCAVDVTGEPPGKTHEYLAAVVFVPKTTDPPAGMVEVDDTIEPTGGAPE